MNISYRKKLIIILLIATGIGIVLLFLRGNEDTWICKDGNWIKHGNPTATMPASPCK